MSQPVMSFTPEYLAMVRRQGSVEIRRQFRAIPPPVFVSAKLTELDQQVRKVQIRRRELARERDHLTSDLGIAEALDLDRQGVVAAMESGKDASSAGAPAADARRARVAAIDVEFDAQPALINGIEQAMEKECARLSSDDKASGRAAAAKAAEDVKKALDALEVARSQYWGARTLVDWLQAAGDGADSQWSGPTTPSLDLAEHGPRWSVRGYASDPPLTIELSDVVRLLEVEMGGTS